MNNWLTMLAAAFRLIERLLPAKKPKLVDPDAARRGAAAGEAARIASRRAGPKRKGGSE